MIEALILLPLVLLLFAPLLPIIKKQTTGKVAKYSVFCNVGSFFAICIILTCFVFTTPSFAETAVAVAKEPMSVGAGLALLGAGLVMGFSTIGAGVAVASAASAAIGATGEDPKMFVKSLIFVALGEGIPVYGLLIAMQILGKV
ncbi:MAG: ATP synthase subunit C [Clostridia bacterium]